MYADVFKCCRQVYFGEETSTKRRLGASDGGSGKRLGSVLGRLGSVLGASGERLEGVLERPGRVLGRLEAVLVAFKVVLNDKMSSESAQDPKC